MDRLGKKDVERVKNTLKTFITKTAGCEDSEELHRQALSIFGKEFADKPSLIKQAASAYNSNKSIFKLSNEETANTDFGLLNPDRLFTALNKSAHARTIEKAASSDFVVRFYKDEQPLQKVASASSPARGQEEPETMTDLQLSNYMNAIIGDREKLLIKSATRRDICAREALDYYDTFCMSMNAMTKEARADVAKNIISAYPEDGKQLIDRYLKDNQLSKMASFKPSVGMKHCPQGDIYTKAQSSMVAEFAKNQADKLFKEAAADTVQAYKHIPGLYKMYKNASIGVTQSIVGSTIAKPFSDTVFASSKDKPDIYKDITTAKLLNQLREIEVKNVLVDMYSEPFIASYPADEIEAATTQALQMLPVSQRKHPRRHVSLIKTWVADILGRGGNMSAADTDKILSASKALQPIKVDETDPIGNLGDLA